MSTVDEEQIRNALAAVKTPEGQPITESGLLAGIAITDGRVQIALQVDPAMGPAIEDLRQAVERTTGALPGVEQAMVALTAERAPKKKAAKSAAPPSAGGGMKPEGVAHVIAVASGKGGVGKSSVAVNLAVALAQLGHRTGLLDADVYGPSVPRMLGLSGAPEVVEGKTVRPKEAFGLKAMSMGLLVAEDRPMVWRGPMVQGAIQQMLNDVVWAPLDILVVDMPPGTGDAQLTLAQKVALTGAVIVSTPQDMALIDARKGIGMFNKVKVPILGIVENMAYFRAPDTGNRYEIFGHGGGRAEAERLAVPFLGEVPLTMPLRENADLGKPIAAALPDGEEAAIFRRIGEQVAEQVFADTQKAPPPIIFE